VAGYLIILAGLYFTGKKKTWSVYFGLLYIAIFILNISFEYSILKRIEDGIFVPFNEFITYHINYFSIFLLLLYVAIPLMPARKN